MCIVVYKTKGAQLSRGTLKQCFRNNSDGAGFMYAFDGCIYIQKGFFGFKKLWRAYRTVNEKVGDKTDIILHFRIATSGLIDTSNCHPFKVNDHVAFAHNGILNIESCKEKSDTMTFRDKILSQLPIDFLNNPGILALIAHYANGSKFIFLSSDGTVRIIGEDGGIWDKGIWYSNGTYKKHTYTLIRYDGEWENENYARMGRSVHELEDHVCQVCGTWILQPYEKGEGVCRSCLIKMGATPDDIADMENQYRELDFSH